ncbi:MAG: aldo/keto reductase [Gammaproteobacteria bacterium]|nr:aldo/keto reductase [Gammaproteobacteria bacterium]
MQTRQLGDSELEFTTVGLGTWAIGGGDWDFGWGPQDDKESVAAIQRALGLGVNWIDTAAIYGLGHAEEVVAKAIAGRRDQVIVATKCGLRWKEGGTTPFGQLDSASVREEAEASLRRLDVDVIDLYQVHWPNPDEDVEEAWSTIAKLIEEGKVRYAGVSNFTVAQLERIQKIHPVTSLQPPYSMLERGVEDDLLEYCAAHNIGVIAYSPMKAGLLTGKYTRQKIDALPKEDWRRGSDQFKEPLLTANLKLIEQLKPIAERNDLSMGQLAIAWVLRRPEVTAAIVGARRPQQIEETVKAGDKPLSRTDIEKIQALLAEHERASR